MSVAYRGVGKWRSANIWPDDIYPQIYFADESIVFPVGTSMEERFRQNYPGLRVITVDSEKAGEKDSGPPIVVAGKGRWKGNPFTLEGRGESPLDLRKPDEP